LCFEEGKGGREGKRDRRLQILNKESSRQVAAGRRKDSKVRSQRVE
jgi:hypothetical protein